MRCAAIGGISVFCWDFDGYLSVVLRRCPFGRGRKVVERVCVGFGLIGVGGRMGRTSLLDWGNGYIFCWDS